MADILSKGRAATKRIADAKTAARAALRGLSVDEQSMVLAELVDELERAQGDVPAVVDVVINVPDPRPKLRDVVTSILNVSDAPLGAQAIFDVATRAYPGIKKASLDAEISDMKSDGVIVEAGRSDRGALYSLPSKVVTVPATTGTNLPAPPPMSRAALEQMLSSARGQRFK